VKTVLITGAASGIGKATALLAASRGWHCVLLDRDSEGLASLQLDLNGSHLTYALDITDEAALQRLASELPQIDALINNAGISESQHQPLIEQGYDHLESVPRLNLRAPANLITALSAKLPRGAHIVNVASGAGLRAIPMRGLYSPSKAGVIALTQALARARPDWCVNVLSPGFVRTALVDSLIQTGRLDPAAAVAKAPLGRMAEPEEMAQALCFLASDAALGLQGQTLVVDGGSSIFGGSQHFPVASVPVIASHARTQFEVIDSQAESSATQDWLDVLGNKHSEGLHNQEVYPAALALSLLHRGTRHLLADIHAIAVRFTRQYSQRASLTLLLPQRTESEWSLAGDSSAAKMLIATLACEWGPNALRINALEVPVGATAQQLAPVLAYLAGPAAQYLTGQTLYWKNATSTIA
jgi:NAD(P)-dependent dehydrogenase (short-subunit alcohol dehydrogenase family)